MNEVIKLYAHALPETVLAIAIVALLAFLFFTIVPALKKVCQRAITKSGK